MTWCYYTLLHSQAPIWIPSISDLFQVKLWQSQLQLLYLQPFALMFQLWNSCQIDINLFLALSDTRIRVYNIDGMLGNYSTGQTYSKWKVFLEWYCGFGAMYSNVFQIKYSDLFSSVEIQMSKSLYKYHFSFFEIFHVAFPYNL